MQFILLQEWQCATTTPASLLQNKDHSRQDQRKGYPLAGGVLLVILLYLFDARISNGKLVNETAEK